MEDNFRYLNGIRTYSFRSHASMLDYVEGKKIILVAINREKILNSGNDLKDIINRHIGYPDGIGAVWALKRKGMKNTTRIPGCEFWLDIIRKHHPVKSFFLVGSREEIIQKTVSQLKSEFPGIRIAGYRNGFLKDGDVEVLKRELSETKPDVVFIAMGSPKQEYLMNELFSIHPALYQGLGGSFDIYSGKTKRAPRIFQKMGMEGIYRVITEPKRIKREKTTIPFLIKLIIGKI